MAQLLQWVCPEACRAHSSWHLFSRDTSEPAESERDSLPLAVFQMLQPILARQEILRTECLYVYTWQRTKIRGNLGNSRLQWQG